MVIDYSSVEEAIRWFYVLRDVRDVLRGVSGGDGAYGIAGVGDDVILLVAVVIASDEGVSVYRAGRLMSIVGGRLGIYSSFSSAARRARDAGLIEYVSSRRVRPAVRGLIEPCLSPSLRRCPS